MKIALFLSTILLSFSASASDWRLAVGAGYSTNAKINFGEVSDSDSITSYTTELNFNNSLMIEIDARMMTQNSWGYIAGLSYGFERQVKSAEITDSNITQTVIVKDSAKFQSTVLQASAAYMWEQFYLPVGFNYHQPTVTPRAAFNGSMSVSGGLGVQFGLGFMPQENVAIELMIRSLETTLKQTEPTVVTNYGKGFVVESNLVAKYIF